VGLKLPGVTWPLIAQGNIAVRAFQLLGGAADDVGLERDAAAFWRVSDGSTGDGGLRVGDGSESAPTYGFDNNTNTGMYQYSGNVLGWSTNGTRRMTLYSNSLGMNVPLMHGTTGIDGDVGLTRQAPGRYKVSDGGAGYGDLEVAFPWLRNETAAGAATATLTNAPAGAAGNPDKWLQVKDSAGTIHVIPAWTP
jgi:hypothetical protein